MPKIGNEEYVTEDYGKWVKDETYDSDKKEIYRCSVCGHYETLRKDQVRSRLRDMNYCPDCGSVMMNGSRKKRQGAWVKDEEHFGKNNDIYVCSECSHRVAVRKGDEKLRYMKYCPDCGAHMKKPKEIYDNGNNDTR